MSVQRYLPSTIGTAFTGMAPAVSGGDYVLHSDYAALEAENARLTERCAGLERERNEAILELDYVEILRIKWMMERTDLFQVIKDARAKIAALQAKLAAAEDQLKRARTQAGKYILLGSRAVVRAEAAEEALRAYIEAYTPDGHFAPHDCFSTGPLAGSLAADMLACPGCIAKKKSDAILAGHSPATKGEGDESET